MNERVNWFLNYKSLLINTPFMLMQKWLLKRSLINSIFIVWAIIMFLLGLIFYDARLYIQGTGIEQEEKLTLGLTALLSLSNVRFYEINFLYFCFVNAFIIFALIWFSEYYYVTDFTLQKIQSLALSSFSVPSALLFFNYKSIEKVSPIKNSYAERILPNLDNAIITNKRIMVEINEVSYAIGFYTLIIFTLSMLEILIRFFSYQEQENGMKDIDHLVS